MKQTKDKRYHTLCDFRKPLIKPFERQSLNEQCLTNVQYEELPDLPLIITKLIFPERKSLRTDLKNKCPREQRLQHLTRRQKPKLPLRTSLIMQVNLRKILGFIGTMDHADSRKPLIKSFERQSLNKQCLTNAKYEEPSDLPIIITKLRFPERRPLMTNLKDKCLREQ